jgi:poly(A) polymerase
MTAPVTMRLDDDAWLRAPAVRRVLELLNGGGEEARVVGGAARNALLHVALSDVDVATTALPDEVMRRAGVAGIKAVPTGIEHGTVTLVIDGIPFEVTTLREDVETFGRKANVAFGRDWKVDAERRDFTINALSITPDGVVHDYVGGLDDLAQRRVRFIGDPARRIAEDYLRILRFFRFQASYSNGVPDRDGLHACIVARDGLATLSRERVCAELMKLLVAPYAVHTITVMAEAGFAERVLGGVPQLASFAGMVEIEAAMVLGASPVRRLGALGVVVAEDAERLRERLRLSNAEYQRLEAMADRWWQVAPSRGQESAGQESAGDLSAGEASPRAALYRLGPVHFLDRVLLAWSRAGAGADARADDPSWRALATLPERWEAPRFPLRAADLMSRGLAKGPALGAALAAAEQAWIAAGFPADPEELAKIADRVAGLP